MVARFQNLLNKIYYDSRIMGTRPNLIMVRRMVNPIKFHEQVFGPIIELELSVLAMEQSIKAKAIFRISHIAQLKLHKIMVKQPDVEFKLGIPLVN